MARVSLLLLLVGLLVAFVGSPLLADEKATHEGKFVKVSKDKEFVMADDSGKEHSHTLADDAKLIGLDGKDCKLSDFKKGQKIRVTTAEGKKAVALKVEAIK